MNTISERFKYLLKHLKITQKKFAQLSGMVEQDTTRISTGSQDKGGLTIGMREKIEQAIRDGKLPAINLDWLEYGNGTMLHSDRTVAMEPQATYLSRDRVAFETYLRRVSLDVPPERAAVEAKKYTDEFFKVFQS